MDKDEATRILPSLIISQSAFNSEPSGVLVLMMAVFKPLKTNDNKRWNLDDCRRIKRCKPNIIHSSSHHQSSGYYASFGNKGSFDKATTSSVGQYSIKKKNTLSKQLPVNIDAAYYEASTSKEISRSVTDLSTIFQNIRSVISPVLETLHNIELNEAKLNMKEVLSSKDGCWQSSLCIDAVTKLFHTEKDCTYTLITIPLQECKFDKKDSTRYDFIFKINDRRHINVRLTPGISFIFSGYYLTHRQSMSKMTKVDDQKFNFINIASYGNKRLFAHIRKTINRLSTK
jgi:hypothetical protein